MKSRFFLFFYWIISSVSLLACLELWLSILWKNPYFSVNNPTSQHTRFYPKGVSGYSKVTRLYEGNHYIRLAVTDKMFISDGKPQTNKKSVAMGGSTTECGLVQEGQRWPDLLELPTLNYGVSGNTSIDGYFNLKFLTESQLVSPNHVFIMYAVNDLRAFLNKGADNFKLVGWYEPSSNPLVVIDQANKIVFGKLQLRDSALLSFLKYHSSNFFGRRFYANYRLQRKFQEKLEYLDPSTFEQTLKIFREDFLPARKKIYLEWHKLALENNLKLTFLTQPHAFYEKFIVFQNDLRLLPVVQGKKMTLQQAALLMHELNDQTKAIAKTLGHSMIDTADCFAKPYQEGLFYDSVHYTLKGSRKFSKCINEGRERQRDAERNRLPKFIYLS